MMNPLTADLNAWGCRPLDDAEKAGYLDWSLDFFTDGAVQQDPFVDVTLQLEISDAYADYTALALPGLTFFSFLIWHLAQALQGQLDFKLRKIKGQWWVLENAPIVVPVALGGKMRFAELLLQNVSQQSLEQFAGQYRNALDAARAGFAPRMDPQTFSTACFVGNLPQLQFTALNLHWRKSEVECQPSFYFGKRYVQGERLMIPLSIKLHHACTDLLVLNSLIDVFRRRFG
jgi:chloramphenicol O-acetyltransferase type A